MGEDYNDVPIQAFRHRAQCVHQTKTIVKREKGKIKVKTTLFGKKNTMYIYTDGKYQKGFFWKPGELTGRPADEYNYKDSL